MVIIVCRYCLLLFLLLVLPVFGLGRTSRGLWDQLPLDSDNNGNNLYAGGDIYIRSNMKRRTLAENTLDKMNALEGDQGFWGMILKMGMKKTKKKQLIKQRKKTLSRHSKNSQQLLSKMKASKTIKLKKRENELLQVPRSNRFKTFLSYNILEPMLIPLQVKNMRSQVLVKLNRTPKDTSL